jgi:hypothetical protein
MAERMSEKLSVYDIVHEMRMSRNFLVQTLVGSSRQNKECRHGLTVIAVITSPLFNPRLK